MRNIAIADRKDWVSSARRPRRRRPGPRSFATRWRRSHPAPRAGSDHPDADHLGGDAGAPRQAGCGESGDTVTMLGGGFERRLKGTLVWAEDGSELASFQATGRGRFTVKVTLPDDLELGMHEPAAVDEGGCRAGLGTPLEVVAIARPPGSDARPDARSDPKPTPEPTRNRRRNRPRSRRRHPRPGATTAPTLAPRRPRPARRLPR